MSESRGRRELRLSGLVSVLLTFVLAMTACMVPPIPLAKRTKSMAGVDLQIDVNAIKPGVSTKEQVSTMLASTAVDETGSGIWARYSESRMSDPGGDRSWGAKNIFVTFNGQHTVEKVRTVGDDELAGVLRNWPASDMAAKELSGRSTLEAEGYIMHPWKLHKATITIGTNGVKVIDRFRTPETVVTLPVENVRKIHSHAAGSNNASGILLDLSIDGVEDGRRTLQTYLTLQEFREWMCFLKKNYPNAEYR